MNKYLENLDFNDTKAVIERLNKLALDMQNVRLKFSKASNLW